MMAIRCVTSGMEAKQQASPIYQSNPLGQCIRIEQDIEQLVIEQTKELLNTVFFVKDSIIIFQHVCWGNQKAKMRLLKALREIITDFNFAIEHVRERTKRSSTR